MSAKTLSREQFFGINYLMRHWWLSYTLSVFFLTILIGFWYWLFNPLGNTATNAFASPLPTDFTLSKNDQVTSLNTWFPSQSFLTSPNVPRPVLSGTSVLSYDLTTDNMLFSLNPDTKMPMASLTKIMTAIVSLEHPKDDDKYFVRQQDLVGEDTMGLDAGEVLSQRELLYGLILHSANDAAETLADNYPGGRNAFIIAMNDKVRTLGLSHTHFTNPTGLQGDGQQYTTANDLLVMTRYALIQFTTFAKVAATVSITIPQTSTHKQYYLENETNLMTSYPGVKGVKTGYTPEAGLCLITYLDYHGHQIVAVLLGSQNRRDDMKEVLDYSLKTLGIIPPAHE